MGSVERDTAHCCFIAFRRLFLFYRVFIDGNDFYSYRPVFDFGIAFMVNLSACTHYVQEVYRVASDETGSE